jgi:hypothetical protein
MMRQIAGSFAEYERARLVAKLKAARERERLTTGKCEGRKSHAEINPEMVQIAKGLRRRKRGNSLRAIAAELAAPRLRQRQRQGVLGGIGGLNAGRLRLSSAGSTSRRKPRCTRKSSPRNARPTRIWCIGPTFQYRFLPPATFADRECPSPMEGRGFQRCAERFGHWRERHAQCCF